MPSRLLILCLACTCVLLLFSDVYSASPKKNKKTLLDYIEHYSRPSVNWYKGIMVEQAKEWEYLSYDVREVRKVAEGFEFLSNRVKEQQRNAYKHVHFHRKCNELGHTPGVKVEESKKTDAYREKLQNDCMDPAGKLNLLKCTGSQWAQYIGSNEDFYENMPGFKADPFKYVPGNALVVEPCNTLSNGAYYKVADVDGVRADKNGNGGNEDMQQAAANMAWGSFYYHGHGNAKHWKASRFADTIAMDFLFGMMFEQMIAKVCNDIDCVNEIYKAYLKAGDDHANLGMFPMSDEQIKPRLLSSLDELTTKGKGFESAYLTKEFAANAANGKSVRLGFENVIPRYTTAVTGIVLLWLRVTFNREIPMGKGDEIFDQISTAIIGALVTKSKQKVKAKAIRDVIKTLNLKVVSDVPKSFVFLAKMLQKFLTAMHFQEVKAGASLLKVFGRYDTCPFVPHSNWHRQSARLIQMINQGIYQNLDTCGLKAKYSWFDKAKVAPQVALSIPRIGSATAGILSIARLGLEPTLQEGSKGLEFQVTVNEGLREAIEKRVRSSSKHAHNKDFQNAFFRRRRRPLSISTAFLERAAGQKVSREEAMETSMMMKGKKDTETKSTLARKDRNERKAEVLDWNTDYRNACNRGPPESNDNVYDNYVKQWLK